MKKIVAKFGGTSLADAGQFRKVKSIVEENPARRYIVASAPGKRFDGDIKVTDMLLNGNPMEDIERRFMDIADELGIDIDMAEDFNEIAEKLKGNPGKSYAASRGEYLNSKLLAAYLGFDFIDPAECIFFFPDGELNALETRKALKAKLDQVDKAVIAGFYGSAPDGKIMTFSRGGSDITGSLAAEAVEADLYENWTDVSGVLAADPRIVDNPSGVEYLTYRELRILSYMGASVLHTDAVYPASSEGIPINIRNTNSPEEPGTMIVKELPAGICRPAITGVAGFKGLSVIQIEKIMVSDGAGFTASILDIFKSLSIPFEQCLTGIDTVTVIIRDEYFQKKKYDLLAEIRQTLRPDMLLVKENLAMVTVVGESASDAYYTTLGILNAVNSEGIEIRTINQGAGKLNLIIGVDEKDFERTINAVYMTI